MLNRWHARGREERLAHMRRDGRLSVSEERALYSALRIIEECGYRWADEGSDLADVASEAADALRGFIGAADDND